MNTKRMKKSSGATKPPAGTGVLGATPEEVEAAEAKLIEEVFADKMEVDRLVELAHEDFERNRTGESRRKRVLNVSIDAVWETGVRKPVLHLNLGDETFVYSPLHVPDLLGRVKTYVDKVTHEAFFSLGKVI